MTSLRRRSTLQASVNNSSMEVHQHPIELKVMKKKPRQKVTFMDKQAEVSTTSTTIRPRTQKYRDRNLERRR